MIGDRMASLIIVLNEGTLKQTLLTLDPATTEKELEEAARRLNASCAGPERGGRRRAPSLVRPSTAQTTQSFALVRRAG